MYLMTTDCLVRGCLYFVEEEASRENKDIHRWEEYSQLYLARWSGQGLEIAAAHRDISLLCVSCPLVSDTMDIMHAIAIKGEKNKILFSFKRKKENKKKRHDGFPFL